MKLHYHPRSPNSIPVLAVAHHLGIHLDLQEVNLLAGDQRKPDFLRLNPNGKVPTLEDGDFRLWESNAIMQYIASKKPNNSLWPQDERVRADISRWQFWRMGDWGKATATLVWENLIKKWVTGGDPDPEEVKRGEELFHGVATILNGHLQSRNYLVGSEVTLADFSVAAFMVYAEPCRFPLDRYNQIRSWYARIEKLDAWQKTAPPRIS